MKTVVITGVTSGIGKAVMLELLKINYHVIGIGRSEDKLDQLRNEIDQTYLGSTYALFKANLLEEDEVIQVANEIKEYLNLNTEDYLDGLVNNVGGVRNWFATNKKGYEHQFALNHLSSFLLTYYLLANLKKAKGRILFTSSQSHRHMKINWDDVMYEKHYHPLLAYKQSKLANVLFAYELNHRYEKRGVRAYAVDPGLVNTDIGFKQTGGMVSFVWKYRKRNGKSPFVPAKTFVHLLTEAKHPEGLYYYNSKPVKYNSFVNKENALKLFELSESLTGIKYEAEKWYL